MSNKEHFHPFAILTEFVQHLRGWLFAFILAYINLKSSPYFWPGVVAFVLIMLLWTVISYCSTYYQISREHVVIYRGIFNKRETIIPYNRIQTVKERQWFFFKPFQLVQLLIETAGGDSAEAEASLTVIKKENVQLIERYRHEVQQVTVSEMVSDNLEGSFDKTLKVKETTESTLTDLGQAESDSLAIQTDPSVAQYAVTNRDILMFALTDLGMITAMFTIFFFLQEYLPKEWFDKISKESLELIQASWFLMIGIILIVLVIIAAFSVLKSLIKYYKFNVSRKGKTLTIESGLFERKTQKIPLTKIQGIKIKQPVMRKIFGIVSVELSLAGGQTSDDTDTSDKNVYLLPIISEFEVFERLNQLLPEWQFEEPAIVYTSHQKFWYFLRWQLLASIVVFAIGSYFSFRIASIVGVLLILLSLLSAWLQSRFQGYAIQSANRVCLQVFRFGTKTLTFIEKEKVQAFAEKTSVWLYEKQIGHASVWVKSALADEEIGLRYLDFKDIRKLKQFYRGTE